MKMFFGAVVLGVFCWTAAAVAGDVTPTGDKGWDAAVAKLNAASHGDGQTCAAKMDQRYGFDEGTAKGLIDKHGMSFGDACIAMKLARVSNHSLEQVMGAYEFHRDKGWGVVAQDLGIAPGSKEFHELKNDNRAFLSELEKSGKKVVHHKTVTKHDDKGKAKGKTKARETGNSKHHNKPPGTAAAAATDNSKKDDTAKPGKGQK